MPSRDFTSEDLFSSRMISMQSSTHSSQMKTVGPAMSLRTSCCDLPQNEQYRVFFESADLLMRTPPPEAGAPHLWILDSPRGPGQGQSLFRDNGMSDRQLTVSQTTTEFISNSEETAVFTGQKRRARRIRSAAAPV